MDSYEVNVLTRKGGWKKLPQEVIHETNELKTNNSDNLKINVNEETFENSSDKILNNNLFENFTEINNIINKLKNVENEKNLLINELNELMKNFEIRKNSLDKKLIILKKKKKCTRKQ